MASKTVVLVSDFEKVCRVCMEFSESFIPIVSFKIIDMISSCTSVQIWENDELPNQICNACFLQLQNTITFKQLCEKSDTKFREIIDQNKCKIEVEESKSDEEIDIRETRSGKRYIFEADVKIETGNNDLDLLNDLSNDHFDADVKSEGNDESDKETEATEEKAYACEKCGREFKKLVSLSTHMRMFHRAKVLRCSQCSSKSWHPLHLSFHEQTHAELTCDVCNKICVTVERFNRHRKVHFKKAYRCPRCDQQFVDKHSRRAHIKEMHYREVFYTACHVCGKSVLKKNMTIHMATHEQRDRIACKFCTKSFIHQQSLENHIKRVHENLEPEWNFLCSDCGRRSRSYAELQRHILIHTKERPFACDKCDKTYRRTEALKMHISRAHLDERNFVCTYCSQAFYDKKILKNHVRRHTGEKPFQCHVCEKAFIQKIALKIHMKVHGESL